MTLPNDPHLQHLQFYATTAYPCGYLEGRQARSLIAAPHHLIDERVYSELIRQGFRRSGKFAYRPYCEQCQACVPVRLPVAEFRPGRSQRRIWQRHGNLTTRVLELEFIPAHFALYRVYQQARHAGGGMDADGAEQYRNFLAQSNVKTLLVEFREDEQLRMVSVVDCVADGLSAVYTFYDCSDAAASYGTYNVLWLADWCRQLELPYLYLGYWIAESRKMAYKSNFRPLQGLVQGEWKTLEKICRAH
ncbi:MAG TPA: arginyltransferase [Methylophilaceae bacterium]|nr:arginyltransferase [Methylophilaceae bacterium]HQR60517.1 arginyltransferase [Methylophilaceae bacterium]